MYYYAALVLVSTITYGSTSILASLARAAVHFLVRSSIFEIVRTVLHTLYLSQSI
jgi:hypothetical protein